MATEIPKGLKLLDHYYLSKKKDSSGKLIPDGIKKLNPVDINPGYLNASDEIITGKFDKALKDHLNDNFKSIQNDISVAIVDLAGRKLSQPEFAGWRSTVQWDGWSMVKVLSLYAAHQLLFDLNELAKRENISTGKELVKVAGANWKSKGVSDQPKIEKIFDFSKSKPVKVSFNENFNKNFEDINENSSADGVISNLKFPFIASVSFQTGLFHTRRGGLWLSGSYSPWKAGSWGSNPMQHIKPIPDGALFKTYGHNATALSLATLFTLLVQKRLANDFQSKAMQTILLEGCTTTWFPLTEVAQRLGNGCIFKCGLGGKYVHLAGFIKTKAGKKNLKYVFALLTKSVTENNFTSLIDGIDTLVQNNN